MTITAYNNHSDSRDINKVLTDEITISNCILKDDTEIVNPTLIFAGGAKLPDTINYIYIPVFNRYYFVTNKTTENQRILINLHTDVLESRKAALLNNECIVGRSTNIYNAYQVDEDIPMINSNEITITNFPSGFTGESLILTVAGGA